MKIVPARQKMGNVISVVIGDDTINEKTDPETLKEKFQFLGNNQDLSLNVENEDDPENYFDPVKKKWVEKKNSSVKTDNIKFTLTQFSQLVFDLQYRPNEMVTNGKKVEIFARSSPSRFAWLKIEKYGKNGDLLGIVEVCGELKLDGEINENNKAGNPKLTLEIVPSEFNTLEAMKDMGQDAPAV